MSRSANEEAVTALLALAASQDLHRRADAACREWLRSSAAEDDLRGWTVDEIEVHFGSCALVFDHGLFNYPFVETRLKLYVREPGRSHFGDFRPVGHYRLITLMDGTPDDDYFVLDTDKPKV